MYKYSFFGILGKVSEGISWGYSEEICVFPESLNIMCHLIYRWRRACSLNVAFLYWDACFARWSLGLIVPFMRAAVQIVAIILNYGEKRLRLICYAQRWWWKLFPAAGQIKSSIRQGHGCRHHSPGFPPCPPTRSCCCQVTDRMHRARDHILTSQPGL